MTEVEEGSTSMVLDGGVFYHITCLAVQESNPLTAPKCRNPLQVMMRGVLVTHKNRVEWSLLSRIV